MASPARSHVDVRYVSLGEFHDKLMSTCLRFSGAGAGQQQCPGLSRRLRQHRRQHHRTHVAAQASPTESKQNISQQPSKNESEDFKKFSDINTNQYPEIDNKEVTAYFPVSYEDSGTDGEISNFNYNSKRNDDILMNHDFNNMLPLINKKTPFKFIYKTLIEKQVNDWIKVLPVFPCFNEAEERYREILFNDLIDTIYNILTEMDDTDYENNLKTAIDYTLEKLSLWYLGDKQKQSLLRNDLRRRLLFKLTHVLNTLNTYNNITVNRAENKSKFNNNCTELFDSDNIKIKISNWLNTLKFDNNKECNKPINKDKIVNSLFDKLNPLVQLSQSYYNKLQMKEIVFKAMDSMPIFIHSCRSKEIHFNRYAEDLVDSILGIQTERSISITKNCHCRTKDSKSQGNFKDTLTLKISECLHRANINDKEMEQQITTIITENINYVSFTDIKVIKSELYSTIKSFHTLPSLQTLDVVNDIIDSVRSIMYRKCTNSSNRFGNNISPQPIFVYQSSTDVSTSKCPGPSNCKKVCCKGKEKNNIKKLSITENDFIETIDVLENRVLDWMKEHPLNYYMKKEWNVKKKIAHELSMSLLPKLKNKNEQVIKSQITEWLNKLVSQNERKNIDILAENLKQSIITVPQKSLSNSTTFIQQAPNVYQTVDQTLKEFVEKFIEYNYDIDNSLAHDAFKHLLLIEIQNLNIPIGKLNNDKLEYPEFSPMKFRKELEYIKEISEWINNLPIEESFNVPGNQQRIDIINDLTKNIYVLEEERQNSPNTMDYNYMLVTVIGQSLLFMPIFDEYRHNSMPLICQLLERIDNIRSTFEHGNTRQMSFSLNRSDIQEQNLSEFIEEYALLNGRELFNDELKQEAWIYHLLSEIKKVLAMSNPNDTSKAQMYNKLGEISDATENSIDRFIQEMQYAKEITDWSYNFPLLPIMDKTDRDHRAIMISELARQVYLVENSNINNSDKVLELEKLVKEWISSLPLEPGQNVHFPILFQQLLRRIQKTKDQNIPNQNSSQVTSSSASKSPTKTKCSLSKSHKPVITSPEKIIIETVEKWSNNVPLNITDEKEERSIKSDISIKLFKKICELSSDPFVKNYIIKYKQLLTEEAITLLETLPNTPEVEKSKMLVEKDLVDKVIEAISAINESTVCDKYKFKLESTIQTTIPGYILSIRGENLGLEMYKKAMVKKFILDNFDHSNEDIKMKYEKKLNEEINNFFECSQNKYKFTKNPEEIHNEVYSTLFRVARPHDTAVVDEVEIVKTRCEIDEWFNSLPLRPATDIVELLEWDQILSMLTEKIHEIEKNKPISYEKIHKEIMKALEIFPFQTDYEETRDYNAYKLIETLKYSVGTRHCTTLKESLEKKKSKPNGKYFEKSDLNIISQPGGSSNYGGQTAPSQYIVHRPPPRKSAQIILDIVDWWCQQIPLTVKSPEDENNNKILKDTLATKIIIKLSELNTNREIFDNEFIYDALLDEELEKQLSGLPTCCDFEKSKNARKYQLKECLKSVRPLVKQERARQDYKKMLKKIINTIIEEPTNTTKDEFNEIKDEIVDEYIEYKQNEYNDEQKQIFKRRIQDTIAIYLANKKERKDTKFEDPLVMRNQLISELDKVPLPNISVIIEEVQEIRMKREISDFIDDIVPPCSKDVDPTLRSQIKTSLTKRLHDIERSGHTASNDNKMKEEVCRYIKKLGKEVSPDKINSFIKNLKSTEGLRNNPIVSEQENTYFAMNKHLISGSHHPMTASAIEQDVSNRHEYISMLPDTAIPTDCCKPSTINDCCKTSVADSLFKVGTHNESQLNNPSQLYKRFQDGSMLKSTPVPGPMSLEPQSQYKSNTEMSGQWHTIPDSTLPPDISFNVPPNQNTYIGSSRQPTFTHSVPQSQYQNTSDVGSQWRSIPPGSLPPNMSSNAPPISFASSRPPTFSNSSKSYQRFKEEPVFKSTPIPGLTPSSQQSPHKSNAGLSSQWQTIPTGSPPPNMTLNAPSTQNQQPDYTFHRLQHGISDAANQSRIRPMGIRSQLGVLGTSQLAGSSGSQRPFAPNYSDSTLRYPDPEESDQLGLVPIIPVYPEGYFDSVQKGNDRSFEPSFQASSNAGNQSRILPMATRTQLGVLGTSQLAGSSGTQMPYAPNYSDSTLRYPDPEESEQLGLVPIIPVYPEGYFGRVHNEEQRNYEPSFQASNIPTRSRITMDLSPNLASLHPNSFRDRNQTKGGSFEPSYQRTQGETRNTLPIQTPRSSRLQSDFKGKPLSLKSTVTWGDLPTNAQSTPYPTQETYVPSNVSPQYETEGECVPDTCDKYQQQLRRRVCTGPVHPCATAPSCGVRARCPDRSRYYCPGYQE